jgi:hypothetical protein
MVGRYTHAHQFKRGRRELKFLRTRLGRIIRDIRRKIEGNTALEDRFGPLLDLALRVRHQEQRQRGPKVPPQPRRQGLSRPQLSKPVQGLDQRSGPACHQGHPPRDAPARRHRNPSSATSRRITGRDGDRINAVLAAAGYNFSLLLRWHALLAVPLHLTRCRKIFFTADDFARPSLDTIFLNLIYHRVEQLQTTRIS